MQFIGAQNARKPHRFGGSYGMAESHAMTYEE
jgi:hypothetical protein